MLEHVVDAAEETRPLLNCLLNRFLKGKLGRSCCAFPGSWRALLTQGRVLSLQRRPSHREACAGLPATGASQSQGGLRGAPCHSGVPVTGRPARGSLPQGCPSHREALHGAPCHAGACCVHAALLRSAPTIPDFISCFGFSFSGLTMLDGNF